MSPTEAPDTRGGTSRGAYFLGMRIRPLATSVLFSVGLVACGGDGGTPTTPPGAGVARSSLARQTTPDVPPEDRAAFASNNRDFALALYDRLRAEDGNAFLSPYSISTALAMTFAGAEGETERQMRTALRFELPEERLHPAFNWTALELDGRGEGARGSDDGAFRLQVVNSTWAQDGYPFLDTYLDTLALHYGSAVYLLDFEHDPDGAREVINQWVEDQTENRIEDLIPPGVITPITTLVLTNAIYFNAAWNVPFKEEMTADGTFHRLDGTTSTVPLMHQTAEHRYAEGDGWQAVELRYDAEELAMIFVLPADERFDEIEAALPSSYDAIAAALTEHITTVTLPRFEFRAEYALREPLEALGMIDAFTGDADFSAMDGTRSLFIQAVIHQAFVSVNEAGTEAAAATAVVVGRTSAPEPATIALDRPFLFFIVDHPTGEILFLGRVTDL